MAPGENVRIKLINFRLSSGSSVVEAMTTAPEIKFSNPAHAWHLEKLSEKKLINLWVINASSVVEAMATAPEIKVSNPAPAWHSEKMSKQN